MSTANLPSHDPANSPQAQSHWIQADWPLLSERAAWADPSLPCERSVWLLWRPDSEVRKKKTAHHQ